MQIIGNVILFIFVFVIYCLFSTGTVKYFFYRTKGVPDRRYKEGIGHVVETFVNISKDSRNNYNYKAYSIVSFKTSNDKLLTIPHLIASSMSFNKTIDKMESKFGKLPFGAHFNYPIFTPKKIDLWVEKDSLMKELLKISKRDTGPFEYPILYDRQNPQLFDFKNSDSFKVKNWMYLFFLPVIAFCIFLFNFLLNNLFPDFHSILLPLASVLFLTAPIVGYFFSGFFIKYSIPNDIVRPPYIIINHNFSKDELCKQLCVLLKKGKD